MEFVVSADHKIKMKANEKSDKYLDLVKELKKPWNMIEDGDTNCN